MRLKLKELQRVVDDTIVNEQLTACLREETSRAFGPVIVVKGASPHQIAEAINDRLDVLERTGRSVKFDETIALRFMDHQSAEVRRAVVRLLPESFAHQFRSDRNAYVRHEAAKRLPTSVVMEMFKKNPDDVLWQTLNERKDDERLDRAARLSKQSRQSPGLELSDAYYANLAHKAISDLNGNIEGQWDEPWAHRYCASLKATSGIEIDEKRLWDEVQRQLEDKDEQFLKRYDLKEIASALRGLDNDVVDRSRGSSVGRLLELQCSSMEYVKNAQSVFCVREANNRSIISESVGGNIVPVAGTVPGGRFTYEVETALDRYSRCWSATHRGLNLTWQMGSRPGSIFFYVTSKGK